MKLAYIARVTYASPKHLGAQYCTLSFTSAAAREVFLNKLAMEPNVQIPGGAPPVCYEEPIELNVEEGLSFFRKHVRDNAQD